MERRLEDLIRDGEGAMWQARGRRKNCYVFPEPRTPRRVNGGDIGTGLQWYTRRKRSSASAHYVTNE